MMQISKVYVAAAFAVAGFGGAAAAQGLDQFCLDNVDYLCGGGMVGDCFSVQSNWEALPNECIGDVQTLIEMEREALAEQMPEQDFGTNDGLDGYVAPASGIAEGMSYGGQLRAGPGMDFQVIGTLAEGDAITVLENAFAYYQDYQWFYVDSYLGAGYHWGGIICTYGYVEGVYMTC